MDDDPDDAATLAHWAAVLADGVEAAVGPWVMGSIARVADGFQPGLARELSEPARAAAAAAAAEVGPRVRTLLEEDVEQQRTNPLAVVREAVRFPTEVLVAAGVPAVTRDQFAEEHFPDDRYDLVPGSFTDLDPELGQAGIAWGAAKAFVIKARHRPSS